MTKWQRVLMVLVVGCWNWFMAVLPVNAAQMPLHPRLSPTLLSTEDLPAGFVQVAASEVEGCQAQGDHGEVAAFVFQQAPVFQQGILPRTSVCISSFWLTEQATSESQAVLMRQMIDTLLNNPQAMVEQAGSEAATEVEVLSTLPRIGDTSTGFARHQGNQRDETLLFRRGDLFASVMLRYNNSNPPATSLETIATQLDQRIQQAINSQ